MNSGLLVFIKSTVKHNSGGYFSNKHLVTNSLPSYTNTDRESDWLASWFWEWIPDNTLLFIQFSVFKGQQHLTLGYNFRWRTLFTLL